MAAAAQIHSVKFIAIGDGAVGKTCLLIRQAQNSFPQEFVPTIFDNHSSNVMLDKTPFNLALWDTGGGGEDYAKLRPLSYPQTDMFLLCVSILDRRSFTNVTEYWLPEMRQYAPEVPWFLVLTKWDMRDVEDENALIVAGFRENVGRDNGEVTKIGLRLPKVTLAEAEEVAHREGAAGVACTSARTGDGVNEAFHAALRATQVYTAVPKSQRKKSPFVVTAGSDAKGEKAQCDLM